jgi:organic hydroperoxide reductase OsmC/OhrA
MKRHTYAASIRWPIHGGPGTTSYRAYSRDHAIGAAGKHEIAASSDPAFLGSAERFNPEQLLVASLSSCHMLWYLHLCAVNGVVVTAYRDDASGTMEEDARRSGSFVRVELRPQVTIAPGGSRSLALELHHEAHRCCYIARSVNFPVIVQAAIL